MIELKIKRIDEGINFSLNISFIKVRKKYQGIILRAIQELDSVKQYLSFKVKIVRLLLKVLFVNPQKVSLKELGQENKLFLSWEQKETTQTHSTLLPSLLPSLKLRQARKLRMVKEKLMKVLSTINILAIILQISMFGAILGIPKMALANDMCAVDVDVVLIMDVSDSMADGAALSKCEWSEIKGIPGQGYTWFLNVKYNVSSDWCLNTRNQFDESYPIYQNIPITYTPAKNSKIVDAKTAANSFLDNFETRDQSGLVSFSTTASLIKQLSNDHQTTKNAVNALTTSGSTNIGESINKANFELDSLRANPQAVKTIVLLTDGQANEPYDPLNGITPDGYARTMAQTASGAGYKIFTVGLGSNSEIDEPLLQEIADITGAKYYHSPNGDGLKAIYDEIAWEICQYGSISGCKYQDSDNDADITDENTLSNWEIVLSGDVNVNQLTDENGCYTFPGLLEGNYIVSEGENLNKQPFLQSYPQGNSYNITLIKGENRQNIDFGNYLPICGNSILDTAYGEICEISETQVCTVGEGYNGVQSCDQTCSGWGTCVTQESCGDAIRNGNEECDGSDGAAEHYICTQTCTLEYVPYCGDQQINQITEQCDGEPNKQCSTLDGYNGWQACTGCLWSECQTQEFCGDSMINGLELCDGNTQTCSVAGYNGSQLCETGCDSWNPCETSQYCGDNIVNGPEQCDNGANNGTYGYCNNDCTDQTQTICGNNALEGNEQCDDGNANNGDGCSAVCEIEQILPEDIDNEQECLDAGHYWYDESCHAEPEKQLPINPGDIVINEIMQNPLVVSDTYGEWFEVLNTTDHSIDLSGCTIKDLAINSHTITSLVVPASDYAVLARSGDPLLNGGITPDYVYSDFVLSNSSDQIILECEQTEIDRVEYDGGVTFPDPDGTSMILANPLLDNNVGSNWCESSSVFGAGDRGTPGTQNDSCGGGFPVCGNQILEAGEQCDSNTPQTCVTQNSYAGLQDCVSCSWGVCTSQEYCGDTIVNGAEQCDDGNANNGDGCSSACLTEQTPPLPPTINPGDIVINEIMQNPLVVSDTYGEWFEIYNTTDSAIDLSGCIIRDEAINSHTITSLVVPASDYAVLARSGDPLLNGGITPNYVYSDFVLSNSSDQIILECNAQEIDRVEYDDGATFPDPDGASMILANPLLDNNIGSNWCESTSVFGVGDKGTPGTQNDSCQGIQCQASETSRQCVSDGFANVNYSWNDVSCGQNYSQQEQDTSCTCQLTDTPGDCASDGFRQHNYTYNFNYCGQAYTQNIADQTCNCQETEVAGECVNDTQRQYTFTYNFGYCTIRDSETRTDDTCQQPAPEPEDIDNEQNCLENGYYWYNESCHRTAPNAEDINNQEDCLGADYYWYEQTCHTQAEPPAPEEQGTGAGGGSGAIIPGIIEGSIIVTNITETSVTIEWLSNYFSTSRVIYSAEGESHIFDINDNLAQPPLYGYTNTTPEYDNNPMVTYHSVTLTELEPATTYYFNCISHASPDIISSEHSFLTAGVAGAITTEEQTKIEKINEIRQEIERIRQEIEKLEQKAAGVAGVAGETITVPEIGLSAKTSLALIMAAKINLFFATKAGQALALTLAIYPLFLSLGLRKKRGILSHAPEMLSR